MRRLVWLPVAGFLLIAGAAVAAAAPGMAQDAVHAIGVFADASPSPGTSPSQATGTNANGPAGLLQQVLADLVSQGTITQDQSDKITQALQDKVAQLRTQAQQRQQEMQQERQQIQGFLQDGVITQDEIDQLPADSPLRQAFDSIAKNGQITLDQLRQLPGFGFGFGRGMGPGFGPGHFGSGPGWFDHDNNNTQPNASANPANHQRLIHKGGRRSPRVLPVPPPHRRAISLGPPVSFCPVLGAAPPPPGRDSVSGQIGQLCALTQIEQPNAGLGQTRYAADLLHSGRNRSR